MSALEPGADADEISAIESDAERFMALMQGVPAEQFNRMAAASLPKDQARALAELFRKLKP